MSRLRASLSLTLLLGMASLLIICPAPGYAGQVKWTVVDTPGNLDNVIVSPSEINALAVGADGRTFYVADIPNGKAYESTDSGNSWQELTSRLAAAGAVLPAWYIAAAPDNPNIVAAVTSGAGLPAKVFVSVDGGGNWQDTNCPVTSNIGAIDVSRSRDGYEIVVGTRTGAGGGDVFVTRSAGYGDWVSQSFTGDIVALKFSPGYAADATIAVVYSDMTGTHFTAGVHDPSANATNWTAIYGASPPEITTGPAGSSPKADQIITADLELPQDFSGQAPSSCRCYVSLDAPASTAGIYRIDHTVVHLLMPATATKRISSIAYFGTYGSGKLLAGEVLGSAAAATVTTWFTDAPDACPATCWYPAIKMVTGAGASGRGYAQVAWSAEGGRAYCGTSSAQLDTAASWPGGYLTGVALDESAFSQSADNGRTWNQLSLIDTEIGFISDVVVAPTSDTIYLASINSHAGFTSFDSIWRSTGQPTTKSWERVLCLLSSSNDLILRMSNVGNDQAVFFASRQTDDLRQSLDRGQTWTSTYPGASITDFAVTRVDNTLHIYVLDNRDVRRGIGVVQTWRWTQRVDTSLDSGHNINAAPNGVVVVGDNDQGMVAYSLDGGAGFVQTAALPSPGAVHVVADHRFHNALIIYAASDSDSSEVYNWVVGSNLGWTAMGSPGRSFYGLAQAGTLYGAWSAGATAVDRTLQPEKLVSPYVEWDSLTVGLTPGVVFTREPGSLKVSAGVNLWAIDNRPYTSNTGRLWNFCDCFSPSPQLLAPPPPLSRDVLFQAPVAVSPPQNEVIPIYVETGQVSSITFAWKHRTRAIEYDLWLANDESFNQVVMQQSVSPENTSSPSWTLSRAAKIEPGQTYFWRVRVSRAATGEKGSGQWSEVMSFTVASLEKEFVLPPPGLLTPANSSVNIERSPSFTWTSVPEATKYEFVLARDSDLTQLVTSAIVTWPGYGPVARLDGDVTYYWQVKAVEPFPGEPSSVYSFTTKGEYSLPSWIQTAPVQWIWPAAGLLLILIIVVMLLIRRKKL